MKLTSENDVESGLEPLLFSRLGYFVLEISGISPEVILFVSDARRDNGWCYPPSIMRSKSHPNTINLSASIIAHQLGRNGASSSATFPAIRQRHNQHRSRYFPLLLIVSLL